MIQCLEVKESSDWGCSMA